MYSFETKLRVRYGETDQMGFVYYGIYAQYYEVGRVELLRSLGISYKEIEAMGFALPVVNFNIKYKKPAFYDDELTIETAIKEIKLRSNYAVSALSTLVYLQNGFHAALNSIITYRLNSFLNFSLLL